MITQILESLARKKRILILTHNNPDPDAMSAAFAMKNLIFSQLKKKAVIAYMGVIGRLENRELVKQCKIDMQASLSLNFKRFDHIILVDSQPLAGNVYIPKDFKVHTVIDHHHSKTNLAKYKDTLADVRPSYGSTCTIVTEYYKELAVIPDMRTATALCFGISSDAIGTARDSSPIDRQMLGYLFPHISINKLAKIENPPLPRYHFKTLKKAIGNAVIIGNDLLFCDLEDVRNADLIAETADYLMRMREIKSAFVMGRLDNVAIFSLRHRSTRKFVGNVAKKMVKGLGYGGGHVKSAGGQVPLTNREYTEVAATLKTRLLKYMAVSSTEEKPV